MLSHQRWPYVGRFARGWHRLPGRIPGQPQTRTRARLRIGSPCRAAQRVPAPRDGARRRDRVDLHGAGLPQDIGRGRERRARGEDVVDEQDARRCGPARTESPVHRHPPFGARTSRLGRRRDGTAELPSCGTPGAASDRDGQRARLIEPALRTSRARQRYPRDDIDIGDLPRADDRIGECRRHVAPPRKLQPQHRAPCRTVVDERRSHRRQRRWRTVLTRRLRLVGRVATAFAPGRLDRTQPREALVAERPRARTAPGARAWEQGVEHPNDHRVTLPAATDTARYGARMRIHWASVRSVALVVILGLQSVGLTALAFSFLLIGVVAGRAMDDVFTPGQHVVTITMVTVGAVFVAGCVTAAMAAVAIGAELGYRGTPHAALWRTAVGVAVLLPAGGGLLGARGAAPGRVGPLGRRRNRRRQRRRPDRRDRCARRRSDVYGVVCHGVARPLETRAGSRAAATRARRVARAAGPRSATHP